jgi:DNA-binding GntR family transcriptional regulator
MPNRTGPSVIVTAVLAALADGRLPGGVRLREDVLADHFAVSRTVVREALQELTFLGVVSSLPRRGASIAQPTSRDADELYEARIAIESALMRDFARHCTARDAKLMREHLRQQQIASRTGLTGAAKLLGDFHLLLAELAGNRVMQRILEQLVARTSLLVSMYREGPCGCAIDDHAALIAELVAGNGAKAGKVMADHLRTNRRSLVIPEQPHISDRSFELRSALHGKDAWNGKAERPVGSD